MVINMLPITKRYLTKSDCYKQGKTIIPKGIIIHSLGTPQPNADVIFNNWNKPDAKAAVHALIETNRIIQTLPWNYRPWGCASGPKGSGNNTHIQFEICEPSGFTYKPNSSVMVGYDVKKYQAYFDAVYQNSVDLCAKVCKEYNIETDNIICHSEAYKQGIASNHGDVMHWFPKHGKTMDDFRQAVEEQLYVAPVKTITKDSSKDDIKWLQRKLNKALKVSNSFVSLTINGDYSSKTKQAVLSYWRMLGWNKLGLDNGSRAGKKTINALKVNRVK
jgi:hypothetical protein